MISLSARTPIIATIDQLSVADENIRSWDDADGEIDALAKTLVNGQVVPMYVRKTRDGERGQWAILDGRRRFLAYKRLIKAKTIGPKTQIPVVECVTPEEIAAATVVSNSQRVAVADADILLGIHKMSKEFKTSDEIGKALGIETTEVRRKLRLGALDERLLKAFKAKRVTLDTLKAIARVEHPSPEQMDKWAKAAKSGQLFSYEISSNRNAVTVNDRRLRFIDMDAYAADGGRIEQDLFGEKPDRVLDTDLVDRLWFRSLRPIADWLTAQGLTVSLEEELAADDGSFLIDIPDNFQGATAAAEIQVARRELATLRREVETMKGDHAAFIAAVENLGRQSLLVARMVCAPVEVAACAIAETFQDFVDFDFFVRETDLEAYLADRGETYIPDAAPVPAPSYAGIGNPVQNDYIYGAAKTPDSDIEVDDEGFTVTQHQFITIAAGRALARSLADAPYAAFVLVVATMFQQALLDGHGAGNETRMLQLSTSVRVSDVSKPDPVLGQPILGRLAAYRADYEASGAHPFDWVHDLDGPAVDDLLALLVALQVSTFEPDSKSIRHARRAQAAHVADEIEHDVRKWFRPDREFYTGLAKKKLLEFAQDMGADTTPLATLKRPDLAAKIFELAAEHDYVPPAFSFTLAAPKTTQPGAQDAEVAA